MNVIFISPHFPNYYYKFCQELMKLKVNVLTIGDCPYDNLSFEVKNNVTEYYYLPSLENYDDVYRAVAFYISKYGKIDFIESQNEYWLETEARLRTDFNINSATKIEKMRPMKYKSEMKKVYQDIGVPVARFKVIQSQEDALAFIKEVGYPVVVKPDNGVGAVSTYKLTKRSELNNFFINKNPQVTYIMEEFIDGDVITFDGITDSQKNILIASSHVMLDSIMNTVNEAGDVAFHCQKVGANTKIYQIGKKVVEAFDTRSRYFHFEFFKLSRTYPHLGKKGDYIGLEVNMRAPGGFIPEMVSYSYETNVYALWAQMLVNDKLDKKPTFKNLVGYVGLREGIPYLHHNQQIRMKLKDNILEYMSVDPTLAGAMGDRVYLLKDKNLDKLLANIAYIREVKE